MKPLFILFLCYSLTANCQFHFDFESGSLDDWIQVPENRWELSLISSLSGDFSLHHSFDNTVSGVDIICRDIAYPDLKDTVQISFKLKHGYNPSGSNNWQVFFLSTKCGDLHPDLADESAILVGVNYESSDDFLKIWQLTEGHIYEIGNSSFNYQERVGTDSCIDIKASRYPDGKWNLTIRTCSEPDSLIIVSSGYEVKEPGGKFLGARYEYSSSQDRKLWIDEIHSENDFSNDTTAPGLVSARLTGINSLELEFDEVILSPEQENFWVNGSMADSMDHTGSTIRLWFPIQFSNRQDNILELKKLLDLENNILEDSIVYFKPDYAEFGDVLINELMIDPSPEVYLPPIEYVELFIANKGPLDLSDWTIQINEKSYLLSDFSINTESYILLIPTGEGKHFNGIPYIDCLTSSSVLPNTGGTIKLFNQYKQLVHVVNYSELGKYDSQKEEGGWSLECIDPANICGGYENWMLSKSSHGGSPGQVNSVNDIQPDLLNPRLNYVGLDEDSTLTLHFNERIFYGADHETIVDVNGECILPTMYTYPLVDSRMEFSYNDGQDAGKENIVTISSLRDCAGNVAEKIQLVFERPIRPERESLLINEIMYDPQEDGTEYIEIVNVGEDYLDLRELKISISETGVNAASSVPISWESHLFAPGSYLVVSPDVEALKMDWDLSSGIKLLEIDNWKTLPNNGSCIILTDRSGVLLDFICYDDSLHHDLIAFTEGISLERISFEACNIMSSCWTSAASSFNYGTPGRENSQYISKFDPEDEVQLFPSVISPDGDGFEDVMEIRIPEIFQFWEVQIVISDLRGVRIRTIIEQGFLGSENLFLWDGSDDENRIVFPDLYVVHILLHGNNQKRIFRKACAIRYR